MYLKNFNGNTPQNKKLRTSANVFRCFPLPAFGAVFGYFIYDPDIC